MKRSLLIVIAALTFSAAAVIRFNAQSKAQYEMVPWGQLPPNIPEWGHTISIASDRKGQLLVLTRIDPPILVFTSDGKFVRSFGNGLFKRGHSIDIDRDGFIWTTDSDDNTVYKFSMDGKLLMTLGKRGVRGDNTSHDLFNGPTDVAIAPNGDIFVADGDRNNRIVKFTKEGKFIKIIGGVKGNAPGQFGPLNTARTNGGLVHAIAFDSKGRLVTLESYNPRVQFFDQDGKFLEQIPDLGFKQACGLVIAPDDTIYVGDTESNSIVVIKNKKIVETMRQKDVRPHNIELDPSGTIFLADVGGTSENKMIRRLVKR